MTRAVGGVVVGGAVVVVVAWAESQPAPEVTRGVTAVARRDARAGARRTSVRGGRGAREPGRGGGAGRSGSLSTRTPRPKEERGRPSPRVVYRGEGSPRVFGPRPGFLPAPQLVTGGPKTFRTELPHDLSTPDSNVTTRVSLRVGRTPLL